MSESHVVMNVSRALSGESKTVVMLNQTLMFVYVRCRWRLIKRLALDYGFRWRNAARLNTNEHVSHICFTTDHPAAVIVSLRSFTVCFYLDKHPAADAVKRALWNLFCFFIVYFFPKSFFYRFNLSGLILSPILIVPGFIF